MEKRSLLRWLHQVQIASCIWYILLFITIIHFISLRPYNNPVIPLSSIDDEIFIEVNPDLILKKSVPECDYVEVLNRTKSIDSWQMPTKADGFSPTGIVNGSYVPSDCNPQISVAVLVTYRNRKSQLDVFLPYIHNFLRKQNIHYRIYLIEQQDDTPWNKGLLYNIGAQQAMQDKFPCLILHDVDLLPQDEGNLYACLLQPRHLSASIDKFRYQATYPELIGGVLAIRSDQYTRVGGFSNRFLRWGGEDDDLQHRLEDHDLEVLRLPPQVSHYSMMAHKAQPISGERKTVMANNRVDPGAADDGLRHLHYSTLRVQAHRLFTLIGVHL